VVDDVRQRATSLADEARTESKQALARQKDAAAGQADSVASALRSAAADLDRDEPQASRFVAYAAERLEAFGRQVRDKDIDSLITDAERLGRRSPAAFFAGSVALGFLLSRFLKSSGRARSGARSATASASRDSSGRAAESDYTTPRPEAGPIPARAEATPFSAGATDRTTTPANPLTGGTL
jgi:hypothetical protein